MFFEDHPVATIVGGLAATLSLVLLASAITDPFAFTAVLIASVPGFTAASLGVAELVSAHRAARDSADASSPSPTPDAEPPPLSPEASGPEQEVLFAERVLHERAEATEAARPLRLIVRNW